jgi:hypothetical protein
VIIQRLYSCMNFIENICPHQLLMDEIFMNYRIMASMECEKMKEQCNMCFRCSWYTNRFPSFDLACYWL